MVVNSNVPSQKDIKLISERIRRVNDAFAENVELVLQRQSIQIEQKRIVMFKYFTLLKSVLIILLPIVIVLGYLFGNLIFCFDVF